MAIGLGNLQLAKTTKLSTFRYCDPRKHNEGLRIGTTRLPPRGVTRDRWQADNYFDVWFPAIAPSRALIRRFRGKVFDRSTYELFCASYERELLASAMGRQAVQLIAAICRRMPVSIGCYCEDPNLCHRTHLAKIIRRAARSLS